MADVQPFRALTYNPDRVEDLGAVTAPPYDVIAASDREGLAAQSPYNVVHVDLPRGDSGDRYQAAAQLLDRWRSDNAVITDEEPALWLLEQNYEGPDGRPYQRVGFFARVKIDEYGPGRIRPHERTHPGPKEDRLKLMRATRANLSPIFCLYHDPTRGVAEALGNARPDQVWGEVTDQDGTTHRLWRIGDQSAHVRVAETLKRSELLIADGHHRYETARVYSESVGQPGGHEYALMFLVGLTDPGLTVFPTDRLVKGLSDSQRQALATAIDEDWVEQESDDSLEPPPSSDIQIGYIDRWSLKYRLLKLGNVERIARLLADKSEPYRQLDTAVLEALILKATLGLSDEDISHLNGLAYARSHEEALERVEKGESDAAFFLRPTRLDQIRAVAAAGDSMPPKSTYFYPKVLSGMLFYEFNTGD